MRDQAGTMKGSIENLVTGIVTAAGTIITATNQIPIKSSAHIRIKNIAIRPMKSMAIPQTIDTAGIILIVLADPNITQKAIPTEILST
jgi:hypothetical protein